MDTNENNPSLETRTCKCCGIEKQIDKFRKYPKGGYTSVCLECAKKHYNETRREKHESLMSQSLKDYTPRELMEELARRGYVGKLSFTRVETIDITNF